MEVLATRTLSYLDDTGTRKEVVLTVFVPFLTSENLWKCEFDFDPPVYRTMARGGGVDFIHALLVALKVAQIYLDTSKLWGRIQWRGMLDCGLPLNEAKPASLGPAQVPPPEGNARGLDLLTTRCLGYPEENGVERERVLTLFAPMKTKDEEWKCGFTFDPPPDAPVRYGVGADALEALLDALAGARAMFEGKAPIGWEATGERLDCGDLPYKIGRSFRTNLAL